jgi:hypothetical protein
MSTVLLKENLKIGQRYRATPPTGTELFVNDNYQFGVWIETRFNDSTTIDNAIASGKLDTKKEIIIIDLMLDRPDRPNRIELQVTKIGGYMPGIHTACIELDLFLECFSLV